MSLNKDILGQALFDVRNSFNNRTHDDLVAAFGDDNAIRLAICKAEAVCIINHFTTYGVVPALGLIAPNGAVTGSAKIN